MNATSIDVYIAELRVAETNRVRAIDSIIDTLFRLAYFLAKVDRLYVSSVTVNGYIAPIPVDVSPSSLYDWRFLKQGTVRHGKLDPISLV